MSETTEFKPITEIAREEFPIFYEKLTSFERRLLVDFGKTIRDSDRQHWLEVACKAVCEFCEEGEPLFGPRNERKGREYGHHCHPTLPMDVMCKASAIRSAFTAQEKNNG